MIVKLVCEDHGVVREFNYSCTHIGDPLKGVNFCSKCGKPLSRIESDQERDCPDRFVLSEKTFCNNSNTHYGNCIKMIEANLCPRGFTELRHQHQQDEEHRDTMK